MSSHTATIRWSQDEDDHFTLGRYTRVHEIAFDGGTTIEASGAPGNVPAQFSSEASVDPEEMFVASLASCHMLFFVDLARRAGLVVDRYTDEAEGLLEKRDDGKMWMSKVTLRPRIDWGSDVPDEATLADLHHKAHDLCFIANSVTSEVVVEH